MNIDFKGYKHALVSKLCSKVDVIRQPFFDYPQFYEAGDYQYLKSNWTLHTNPDYKEKEMKSDRLADEIMEKGKESVYTQEMFNAGEAPQIGMMLIFKHNDELINGTVLAITEDFIIIKDYTGKERIRKLRDAILLPIDQRTNIQKAIDDMAEQLTNEGIVGYDKIMLNILVAKFKAGKIHGVSFTGDKK